MKIEINKKITVKIWSFLFLMLFSCTNNAETKISVEKIHPVPIGEKQKLSLSPYINTIIVISSDEDLNIKNKEMPLALIGVENKSDFQLPDEKREKATVIFEIVNLKKISEKEYKIYMDGSQLRGKILYCRLERPGFIGQEGYKSPVFKLDYQ